jgi:hypothetical protein
MACDNVDFGLIYGGKAAWRLDTPAIRINVQHMLRSRHIAECHEA